MISLDDILAALGTPPHEDGRSYRVVSSPDSVHLAISASGNPALLVPIEGIRATRNANYGGVSIVTQAKLRFQFGEQTSESAAIVVEGRNPDQLQSFTVFLFDLLRRLRESDTDPLTVIDTAVDEWRNLLALRGQLSPEQEMGLWGELTLLESLPDLARGFETWVGPAKEHVDFRGGGVALECKSSSLRGRHVISLDQVEQVLAGHFDTYLVSLWVAEDPAGATLPELVNRIQPAMPDEAGFRKRLLQAGYAVEHVGRYTMRYVQMRDPLFVAMTDVPRVRAVDPGVTNVRFTTALDDCTPLPPERVAGLLAQLLSPPETDAQD